MGQGPLVSPPLCVAEALFWLPSWRDAGGAQALQPGSRPQRMEAQAGGPPVSQHRNGCSWTWHAPASELPGTPGALWQPRTGSSQQAARTCAPTNPRQRYTRKPGHQASLLGSEVGGKIRSGRHGSQTPRFPLAKAALSHETGTALLQKHPFFSPTVTSTVTVRHI